jgi:hypothetical protein
MKVYTVRFLLFVLSALPGALFLGSCDNSFTPKEEYRERLVVFAVLSNTQKYQVVRLESTYDAEGTNPDKPVGRKDILSAEVVVSSSKRDYIFTDTMMAVDGGAMKKVWISREIVPAEGKGYTLKIKVPGYNAVSAATVVPSKSYLQFSPPNPQTGRYGVIISAGAISTVAPPKGFLFRLWVMGTKVVNGETVEVWREAPARVDSRTGDTTWTKPSRESAAEFSTEHITTIKNRLEQQELVSGIMVIAIGYSMDTYLYNYFQTVRGFDDPVSVRMDRPDITNVSNGIGVFGAVTADSLRATYTAIVLGK